MKGRFREGLEKIFNSIKKNTKIGILLTAAGLNLVNFDNVCRGEFRTGKLKLVNYLNDVDFSYGNHNALHYDSGTEGWDSGIDRSYGVLWTPSGKTTKIVSIIPGYELLQDVRHLESLTPADLELSIHTQWEGPITFSNLENELRIQIDPQHKGWDYGSEPVTLWERNVIDPNNNLNNPNNYTISFMADIREAIDKSGFYWDGAWTARIPVVTLNGAYDSQVPYFYPQVRFNTFPGDFDLSGRVDLADIDCIGQDWNKTDVNSVADISGPNGIPDKNVNFYDLSLFTRDYLKDSNDPNTWREFPYEY